jgi:hypothetical protein
MKEEIEIRKLPPVWFIRLIDAVRSGLLWLNRHLFPANIVLYEKFQNLWLLPCIRVAAELDIASLLREKPRTAEELASLTGSNLFNLARLLRALASQGIFKELNDHRYANTRLSAPLTSGKGSLRYMILQHLGELNWNSLGQLSYSVKTGNDAFSGIHGKKIYEYLGDHPDQSDLFDQSMTNLTELAIEPVLSVYDFSTFRTIADIGGGEGLLLSGILYKNKNVHGILFDLPDGLGKSPDILQRHGVSDRVKTVTGSFFEKGLPGADAYLLKNIIHNWDDKDSITILSNICEAMPDKGKVLVLEMIIPEGNSFSYGKLIDIQMMVFMGQGRERTREEYELLFRKSGLALSRIVPTIAPFSIIEAVKV